jgi:hypothetical protein
MKSIILFFIGVTISFTSLSQNSCSNPDTIVTGGYYVFPLDTNAGNAPAGPDYGCLSAMPNPIYFFTEICSVGNLQISLSTIGSAADIDFICWGPMTGITNLSDMCTQVSTGSIGHVDCSYSIGGFEIVDIPNGLPGQFYLIMVTNFNSVNDSLTVQQTGGNAVTCDSIGGIPVACGTPPLGVCEVTMNDSATHCKILWEKIPGLVVDYYYIHRLNAQSNYVIIDSIPENDSSFYVDYSSVPSSQPYRYMINYRDSCGNISDPYNGGQTPPHQSIHLQASPGFNAVNLDWDAYIGLNFSTYYIFRGIDPFNMTIIDSISSAFTSYTDLNPNVGEPCYQVGFINPDPCLITRSGEIPVVSNVFNTDPLSINEFFQPEMSVFPNPAEDKITVKTSRIMNGSVLRLTDISGRTVYTAILNGNEIIIPVHEFSKGIYSIILESKEVIWKAEKLILN